MTSKILFEDVIKTINDYGFASNPYPIILSIENHCKAKQQERMAEILENILKNKLYLLPDTFNEFEYFPSPNKLKHKILIKDKGQLPALKVDILMDYELTLRDMDEEDFYMSNKLRNFNNISNYKTQTFFRKYHNIIQNQMKDNEELSVILDITSEKNLAEKKHNSLPDYNSAKIESKEIKVVDFKSQRFATNNSQSPGLSVVHFNKKTNELSNPPNLASERKMNQEGNTKENNEKVESNPNLDMHKHKKTKEKCEKLQNVKLIK